jgi:hypothetical protein
VPKAHPDILPLATTGIRSRGRIGSPHVVGGSKRLFRDGSALKPLRLVESQTTSTGAIPTTYAISEGP